MKNWLLKNWKTTLSSAVTAIATFVVMHPDRIGGRDTLLYDILTTLIACGIVTTGAMAKDYDTNGK